MFLFMVGSKWHFHNVQHFLPLVKSLQRDSKCIRTLQCFHAVPPVLHVHVQYSNLHVQSNAENSGDLMKRVENK